MRKIKKNTAPASSLATMGEAPAEGATAAPDFRAPYVGFYGPKKTKAPEIREGLGSKEKPATLTNGHPFVCNDGEYVDAADVKFTLLRSFPYWVRFESGTYSPEAVWLDEPEGEWWKQDIKGCVLGLMLHVTPGGGAFCSVADLQGTKSHAGKQHNAAIVKSQTDSFAKKNGDLVAKASPALRVFSTFNMKPSGPTAKFPHVKAHAKTFPTDEKTWDALVAWGADEAAQAQMESCSEVFDKKVARLKNAK